MAVMRVERTDNYTVMANYHLRDKRLSLKAKGLLSVMLSLPPEWDFTLTGLAYISKEGVDAIRAGVKELENCGYVTRKRLRNSVGQLVDTEYTIYEVSQKKEVEKTCESKTAHSFANEPTVTCPGSLDLEKPTLELSALDVPTQETPTLAYPTEINKEIAKKDERDVDALYLYQSNPYQFKTDVKQHSTFSVEKDSPYDDHVVVDSSNNKHERTNKLPAKGGFRSESIKPSAWRHSPSYSELVQKVKDQIDYCCLIDRASKDEIENILSIMVEVLSTKCEYFTISGKQYPTDLVHQRFRQINSSTIEYVLECLHKCGSDIRNIKQYLIAALFNAPATYDSYYSAAARRDFEFLRGH